MMKQLRKSFFTCWGWAEVPMSKSLGLRAEQQVAHAAPHQVGHVAVVLQAIEDLQGIGVDVLARDGVLGPRQDARGHVPWARAPQPSDYTWTVRDGVGCRRTQHPLPGRSTRKRTPSGNRSARGRAAAAATGSRT